MYYEIIPEPGYLRTRLFGRETVEEMREFLRAMVEANHEHQRSAILVDVHASRPIFHTEPNGIFDYFKRLAGGLSWRIALLADNAELRLSHEYLALLARQRGITVWSFRDESAALRWLSNRRHWEERRQRTDRRERMQRERAVAAQRRQRERRLIAYGGQFAF
jgi:hypothetical protein